MAADEQAQGTPTDAGESGTEGAVAGHEPSRRGFLRSFAIAGGGLALGGLVGRHLAEPAAAASRPKTAKEISEFLLEGNRRFAADASQHPHLTSAIRAAQADAQTPFAAVLACADSRVAPELIFDQGIGDLFVVRVAGNVGSPEAVASLAYAVEHLGVGFIMVLGHESCGAVRATVDALGKGSSGGEYKSLVSAIEPAVTAARPDAGGPEPGKLVAAAVDKNASMVAAGLTKQSAVIREAVERRKLTIQAAVYDLHTCAVTPLTNVA